MVLRRLTDALKRLNYFSSSSITNGHNEAGRQTVGLGLPGGSVQGPVLVGILLALYERNLNYDVIFGKSIGAAVAASLEGLRLKYEQNPDRYKKYPGGPPQELAELVIARSPLFKWIPKTQIIGKRGLADITRLLDLVKETTDEREFAYFPRLRVVAHIAGTDRDVIFGDVAKDYPVWKGVGASSSLAWILDTWPYDGNPVEGVLERGTHLMDGGVLRISPFKELYTVPLNLRICAFLGYDSHADEIFAEQEQNNGKGLIDKVRLDKRFLKKIEVDVERIRLGGGDRERYDLRNDIPLYTNGKSLEQVTGGAEEGLIVLAPSYEHVRFSTDYPTKRLINAGQKGADAGLNSYFKSIERQNTLRRIASNGQPNQRGVVLAAR